MERAAAGAVPALGRRDGWRRAQDLFAQLYVGTPKDWDGSTLRIVTPDMQQHGIPDLATLHGRAEAENIIGDAELIVLDNLSAWVRGTGEENTAESWAPVLDFLLRQRAQGRTVIVVHHAGKSGQQRGTSKREDALDIVLALRKPADYTPEDGARFEIHFEKARGLHGKAVAPIEARFGTDDHGVPVWTFRPLEESHTARIIELDAEGLSQAEIARELNINRSTVSRALKRMQQKQGEFAGGMQHNKKCNAYATRKG